MVISQFVAFPEISELNIIDSHHLTIFTLINPIGSVKSKLIDTKKKKIICKSRVQARRSVLISIISYFKGYHTKMLFN
jgi:hypothetical protein